MTQDQIPYLLALVSTSESTQDTNAADEALKYESIYNDEDEPDPEEFRGLTPEEFLSELEMQTDCLVQLGPVVSRTVQFQRERTADSQAEYQLWSDLFRTSLAQRCQKIWDDADSKHKFATVMSD